MDAGTATMPILKLSSLQYLLYCTYSCDKIQYVFSKLILTWKFPA